MFLIHNSLGEDSKIFHPDEEPSPSALFKRMNENPENEDELSISTVIRNRFEEIRRQHPDLVQKINQLPARVKSAKKFEQNQINVLRKKGLSLFVQQIANPDDPKSKIDTILIENLLPSIECDIEEPVQKLSSSFWPAYDLIKTYRPTQRSATSEASVEVKANNNLKFALKVINPAEVDLRDFIQTLLKDLRNYHTLPKYTLRRLSSGTLGDKVSKKESDKFFAEVRWIRNHLGAEYLDKILKKVENQELEVIIAIENRMSSIQL